MGHYFNPMLPSFQVSLGVGAVIHFDQAEINCNLV